MVSHAIRTTLRYVLMEGCRRIKMLQAEPWRAVASKPCHSDYTALRPHGRLSPYKNAIINAPASKLAERYYHIFAWLVA